MVQQATKFIIRQTHILPLPSRPPSYHVITTPFSDILLLLLCFTSFFISFGVLLDLTFLLLHSAQMCVQRITILCI